MRGELAIPLKALYRVLKLELGGIWLERNAYGAGEYRKVMAE